jgi:hypothetical protein
LSSAHSSASRYVEDDSFSVSPYLPPYFPEPTSSNLVRPATLVSDHLGMDHFSAPVPIASPSEQFYLEDDSFGGSPYLALYFPEPTSSNLGRTDTMVSGYHLGMDHISAPVPIASPSGQFHLGDIFFSVSQCLPLCSPQPTSSNLGSPAPAASGDQLGNVFS